jgi:chaperonin GroES
MAQLESVLSPLDNRVVVEAVVPATRTAGGLYLPDTVSDSDRHRSGRVIAVGRGKLNKKGVVRPLDVKTGDTVLFTAHSGSEVELEGVQLVILREDEILGVSTAD